MKNELFKKLGFAVICLVIVANITILNRKSSIVDFNLTSLFKTSFAECEQPISYDEGNCSSIISGYTSSSVERETDTYTLPNGCRCTEESVCTVCETSVPTNGCQVCCLLKVSCS
jgi:hypothetical protein